MSKFHHMWRRDAFYAGLNAALGVAALALVFCCLWRVAAAAVAIATPFVASFMVALLLEPLVIRIQRKIGFIRGRRLPAVLLVYLLFLLAFVALLTWLVPSVISEGKELATRFPNYVGNLQNEVNTYLRNHRKLGPIGLPTNVDAITKQYSDQLNSKLQTYAEQGAQIVLGSLSGLLTVVLVPIITFFLLADLHRLRARLLFLMPEKARTAFQHVTADVGGVFGNYIRGMLIVCSLYGLGAMFVFLGFGLKAYALLLGVAAGVLYAVPYVGPVSLALLATIVSLSTGHSYGITLFLLGTIFFMNLVFDNFLVPRIVGDSVGLHPLLTIFALFLGGELFGIWGMLLSVPVAASIQLILFRLMPKLRDPTPVAMAKQFEMPEVETITRSSDEADAQAQKG